MLTIKLQRRGKKHQPSFRLVVQEKRSKLDGDFIDDLGWYNPRTKEAELNAERVKYWIGVGAQPSPTVHNLLVTKGVAEGTKIPVHAHRIPEKKETTEAATPEAAAPVAEAPVEEKAQAPQSADDAAGQASKEEPKVEEKEEKKEE
jgi:small subunit ribosomal protein S16